MKTSEEKNGYVRKIQFNSIQSKGFQCEFYPHITVAHFAYRLRSNFCTLSSVINLTVNLIGNVMVLLRHQPFYFTGGCDKRHNYGFYFTGDESSFIVCDNGKVHRFQCPKGTKNRDQQDFQKSKAYGMNDMCSVNTLMK